MQPNWQQVYEHEGLGKRFVPEDDPAELGRICVATQLWKRIEFTSVLDVGCGDGYMCHVLASAGIQNVVGLDSANSRLRYAKATFPDGRFLQGDVFQLPFQDNSFDLVTAVEVLEHLERPRGALAELKRVSRRYVLLTVPFNERLQTVFCPYCLRGFHDKGHLQSFDKTRMHSLVSSQSMDVLRMIHYNPTIDSYLPLRATKPLLRVIFPEKFLRGGYLGVLCEKS